VPEVFLPLGFIIALTKNMLHYNSTDKTTAMGCGMKKKAIRFAVLGLTIIIVSILSWILFPNFKTMKGGFLVMLGLVMVGVTTVLANLSTYFQDSAENIPIPDPQPLPETGRRKYLLGN
jgi:hypothetical protein